MTEGRHILSRVILTRTPQGYSGTVPIFAFAYGVELRKIGDSVELVVFDGPVVDAYRLPLVDE